MVKRFDDELKNLKLLLIKMADIVHSNISKSIDAYMQQLEEKEVFINDDLVDQYERIIEEHCLDIILRQQPVAKDLRVVSGILKLITDLERIGDHAEDILRYNSLLLEETASPLDSIHAMAAVATKMTLDCIESFVREDITIAQRVIAEDDKVDEMYRNITQELITLNSTDMVSSSFAIYTMIIIKYLERIADHSVNIAEWVIYIISGYHKEK